MAVTDETRRIARARKDSIVELTNAQVVALVSAWVATYETLQPDLERLADDIALQFPAGATTAQLDRFDRIDQGLQLSRGHVEELVEYAGGRIADDIPGIPAEAGQSFQQMLRSQLPTTTARVGIEFGGVNDDALSAMVARTTTQIHAQTWPLAQHMEDAMKRNLTKGIVEGVNPRETARRIMRDVEGDFMGGAARATTIARTESLGAFRAADALMVEANADVVEANIWFATLGDSRTCLACISLHGTEHPLDDGGPLGHPNCRCTYITKLKPYSELGIDAPEPPDVITPDEGRQHFENMTEDTKRQLLGPGRYELWSEGRMDFEDLAVRRENSAWRAAYYERPLKDFAA